MDGVKAILTNLKRQIEDRTEETQRLRQQSKQFETQASESSSKNMILEEELQAN